jgi:hypothetical protein
MLLGGTNDAEGRLLARGNLGQFSLAQWSGAAPEIANNFAGSVKPRRSGDTSAWMSSRTAVI